MLLPFGSFGLKNVVLDYEMWVMAMLGMSLISYLNFTMLCCDAKDDSQYSLSSYEYELSHVCLVTMYGCYKFEHDHIVLETCLNFYVFELSDWNGNVH